MESPSFAGNFLVDKNGLNSQWQAIFKSGFPGIFSVAMSGGGLRHVAGSPVGGEVEGPQGLGCCCVEALPSGKATVCELENHHL